MRFTLVKNDKSRKQERHYDLRLQAVRAVPAVPFTSPDLIPVDYTLDLQVIASADDCSRVISNAPPGSWSLTSASASAGGYDFANRLGAGFRFVNVTIPPGARVVSAYLTLRCRIAKNGVDDKSRISAEAVDNASAIADDQDAFDTRWATRTTARIDWDNISDWGQNTDKNSPDIKTVIQEIVNRANWVSGNSIVIFWEDFEDRSIHVAENWRDAYSYDGSVTYAPKLHVLYSI
mgnify:CR=1 FL=1